MTVLRRIALLAVLTAGAVFLPGAAAAQAADCWGTEPEPYLGGPGEPPPSFPLAGEITSDVPTQGQPADMGLGFFCHWETSDPRDFTVRIAWGDGEESDGRLVALGGWADTSAAPGYQFFVRGIHTYKRVARHEAVATIRRTSDGSTRVVRAEQPVQNAVIEPLQPYPPIVTHLGVGATHRLAGFRDANPFGEAGDYTATLRWSDGTVEPGVVTKDLDGTLVVSLTRALTTAQGDVVQIELRDRDGMSAQSFAFLTGPAPPAGAPGVVIDEGALYTRSRDVTVKLSWLPGARGLFLSNDRALTGASLLPVAPVGPWRLAEGPAGVRSVFARFGSGQQVFTDAIVFDDVAPAVRAVSAMRRRGSRSVALRLDVRDPVSGVERIEVAERRRGGRLHAPAKRLRVRSRRSSLLVRARDRAGNVSAWRTVRVRSPRAARR